MKMRRFIFEFVLIAAFAALAPAVASAAPTATAADGGAFVSHENFIVDFSGSDVDPCTGEAYTFQMRLNVVSQTVFSQQSSGFFFMSGQWKGQGVSGTTYVGTFVSHRVEMSPLGTPPPNEIIVGGNPTFHVIRTGETGTPDDFFFHINTVFIFDLASQTIVLDHANFTSECR